MCQPKNNLHKFFYWLHLVYNTDYHQPMRWLRAMLLRLEQWRLMMPCASAAPRCGACRAGVHSPGRGPGLTESASALRTSDAGLLPESLCRKRCGRRMQGCCLTDSCRFLWHSRGKSRSPGPMSEASSATRCRCVVLRPFDISHTSFLSTT